MAISDANSSVVVQEELLPYRLREHFLTTPEVILYRALKEMAGERYVIYAKVALNDIFFIVRPTKTSIILTSSFENMSTFYCVIPSL